MFREIYLEALKYVLCVIRIGNSLPLSGFISRRVSRMMARRQSAAYRRTGATAGRLAPHIAMLRLGGADDTHGTVTKHDRSSGLRDALIAAATLVLVIVLAACTAAFGWYEHAARPLTIAIGVTSCALLLAALIAFYRRYLRTRRQAGVDEARAAREDEVS